MINNIPKVQLLKVQPQKFDYLSEDEANKLLASSSGVIRDMIFTVLKTGLRLGELLAVEWGDLNLSLKQLTIRQSVSRGIVGSTKTNKIRYIPLLDEMCMLLTARKKENKYIFAVSSHDKPISSVTCRKWLHKACQKAMLRKIGWHNLRHTFASHLAENSVSILLIKELLGHSDVKTTMRYSHLSPLATREAVKTLSS